MRIRLYIAIALTGALSGQVEEVKNVNFVGSDILKMAGLIVSQLLIGALLGVSARIFILALETGASAIAAAIVSAIHLAFKSRTETNCRR